MVLISLLSQLCGKSRIDTAQIGIPEKPIKNITLKPIDKFPSIIVRYQDYDRLKANFDALPSDAPAKRNKMVRAWFSPNEQDRVKATQEFVSFWKNYSQRWTKERLAAQRADGVAMRGVWRAVHLYDIVASYGYLTDSERTEFRDALVQAVEYALGSDPDNMRVPSMENLGWRLSNIWTDVALAPGVVAMAFPELPQAKKWLEFSVNELLWGTENGTWDGAWHECPRYHLYQMKITVNFLIALRNRTGIDLFTHPDIKAQGRWCVDFATPRDLVAGKAANQPSGVVLSLGLGDSTWGENMGVINLLAGCLKDSDPLLSQQLMWLWSRSGFTSSEEPLSDLLIDNNLKAAKSVALTSTIAPTKGYVLMRDAHDTPDEVWFMLKCGKTSMCGHENGDANSFSLMAFGTPLALDAGSGDYGDPNHRAWNKRSVSHNVVAFSKGAQQELESSAWVDGQVLNFQTNKAVDYSATDASAANNVERYVRHVVFVKPHYFVIRDEIKSDKSSVFLLHSPAERIEWDKHKVSLYTPWNTWLDMHVLAPARELTPNEREGQIGAWTNRVPDTRSWYKFKTQKYIEVNANACEDFITVLQPCKEGTPQLKATLSADGKSVEVLIDGRKDTIKFTDNGVSIAKGRDIFEYTNRQK